MLNLVRRLFWRYVDQHRVLRRSSGPLRDASGRLLAEEAEVSLSGGRVTVRARAPVAAAAPGFQLLDGTGFATPMTPEAGDAGEGPWYSASVPEHWGSLRLAAGDGAGPVPLALPGWRARARVLAVVPGFVWRLLRVLPRSWRWLDNGDPMLRLSVLEALGFASPRTPLLDGKLFKGDGAAADPQRADGITIVLPVHNALEMLAEALDRIEANTDLPWHLVVVEDCSSDPRLRPWLRERLSRLAPRRVTLIENERNLGFIGSVNLAFERAVPRGWPVVLLNSDAFVPRAWASRLTAPLMADARVATVTPMSNDAALMTVPAIQSPVSLAPGQGDALDRIAAGFARGAGLVEMPAGVGFCMAISCAWLARVPRFDPAFGRGYGEEVDWCQKVLSLGGRHIGLPSLFVEHHGAASFGPASKDEAIARAHELIARRHPRYLEDVRLFAEADPLRTPRLALAVAWAAGGLADALPVYVAHSLGGGAEIWLRQRLDGHLRAEDQGSALVIRLGGLRRWKLELHARDVPVVEGMTDDLATIAAILASTTRLDFRYSCSFGDPDPASLPDALLRLVRPQDRLTICFHDFFPISPSYTLLDSSDRFRGVPDPEEADPAHQTTTRDGRPVTLREWRAVWGRLAARADRLLAFSTDSASHVSAAWPELAARVEVEPHALHTEVPRLAPPAPGAPFTVAVLGDIGRHKGIVLVGEVARGLDAIPGAPGVVVIGKTDPAYPLPDSVRSHGSYSLAELEVLARRYRIAAWLIPSIWPETFSYATHEALATGLPVIGLGLGAQGEALRRHENGIVVDYGAPEAMAQGIVDAILALRGMGARCLEDGQAGPAQRAARTALGPAPDRQTGA